MADEAAVVDAPVIESAETFTEDPAPVEVEGGEPAKVESEEKQDGRRQPDALRKRIADLKRQADSIADPAEKQRILDDAKELNNRVGKVAAYEQLYPTVREAREAKALVDSFGGRDGLTKAQASLASMQEIDQQLETGNPAVNKRMWDEAPQGMVKLAPMIFSEMESRSPQEYAKAVVPHAIKFFDGAGFPEAFDSMVTAYQGGNKAEGDKLSAKLAQWFSSQRQTATQPEARVDPEVEKLRKDLEDRKSADTKQATDRAYNEVIAHATPIIDKHLKPIVAKLGLSPEQYTALRADTWKRLQEARNADETYKTIAGSKYKQGLDVATAYVKSETESRAEAAARASATFWYGHQLKNGAVKTPNVTATPITNGVTRGKEPNPSEIDYGPKGVQAAKKSGFKDLGDMILAGKAPLKAGGIRQWR